MGKGGGGGGAAHGAALRLERFGRKRFRETKPIRHELLSQVNEALRTGGVGARIPMIQRAVEQSKGATAASLRATEEDLAKVGLAGTPFGQSVLSQARITGEQTTAGIPPQIAGAIAGLAPGIVQQGATLGLQGIGGAGQIEASILSALLEGKGRAKQGQGAAAGGAAKGIGGIVAAII